ncbi:hypothetical protein LguiB_006425 [Lonicera macranthoides]
MGSSDSAYAIPVVRERVYKGCWMVLDGKKDGKKILSECIILTHSYKKDLLSERFVMIICTNPLPLNCLPSTIARRRERDEIEMVEDSWIRLEFSRVYTLQRFVVSSSLEGGLVVEEPSKVLESLKMNMMLASYEDSMCSSYTSSDFSILRALQNNLVVERSKCFLYMYDWEEINAKIENIIEDGLITQRKGVSSKMAKDESISVKEAIHKMQLSLFEGIRDEGQLFAAGTLMCQSDYQDVVTERSIANICGYPLCSNSLPSERPRKGRYRISLKEHKVYELHETYMYCSTSCVVSSRAFAEDLGKNGDLGFSELKIQEKRDIKVGEVSVKEWIGSKTKSDKPNRGNEVIFNEMDFMSTIITQDENGPKPSLKSSGAKKVTRTVTWADDKCNSEGNGNLCEFSEFEGKKEASEVFGFTNMEEDGSSFRFASAEACAIALSQAAEAVASGESDAPDAVYEAGIVILPPPHNMDEEDCEENVDMLDLEPAPVMWSRKQGISHSDFFDSEDSLYDSPPDGFNLNLSPFATMFMALFSWISSSSLAYIYGRDENSHEEYLSVNGREYLRKIVLTDGRSSEIKQTLAGCLSRALPGLVDDLRLPTPISTLEKGLGRLLDTMSFTDALPPFRMKQWQVIILLFLDALSVCQVPALAPHMTSSRMLFNKVLDGAEIGAEEYEIMKDLVIPLGRVPQLSMQSGG